MKPKDAQSAKFKAAVVGGTGYGGAELIRLLLAHPSVALTRVSSIDFVDQPLESVHLSLNETGLTFEEIPLKEVGKGVDVIFLGLPHKVSSTLAPELRELSCKVIDLSGDFRLKDKAAYREYYGVEHPYPEELEGNKWVFGLPEVYRDEIRQADRVASPGCFATTCMLSLLPLSKAGILKGAIKTVATTGSSGSGAYAKAGTHHPVRANNMKIYKPFGHQHTPEIEQLLNEAQEKYGHGQSFNLYFVPVSAPMPRGILANSFVNIPESVTPEEVDALFYDCYKDHAFVRTLGNKRFAEVVAIKGSMWVDLSWTVTEPADGIRQVLISTALDNLVKGGAGQAVQSMNLTLGLPETEGIDAPALWP